MDPELLALLDRINAGELTAEHLATLTDDELGKLREQLLALGAAVDAAELTDEFTAAAQVEALESVVAVAGVVSELQSTRETEQAETAAAEAAALAEVQARREAARAALTPAAPVEEEVAPEPVVAAAARRPVPAAARRAPAAAPRVEATQPTGPRVSTSLVAAADVGGFGVGQELTSFEQLGQALASRLKGLGTYGNGSNVQAEPVIVASLRSEYPSERWLSADGTQTNTDRIDAALAEQPGLVAAGGLCAPLPVDYTIPEMGSLDRPFRDSLTRFGADRGGISTMPTPSLTQADAGFGVWTLANDADPNNAGATGVPVGERLAAKPVVEFDCGTLITSSVYAATFRARYNNIRARYNPEVIASNARMGLVSHARLAELQLMQRMVALSTAVTAAKLLGVSKDYVAHLDNLCAHKRYRTRETTRAIRAWVPAWVRDMIRADFVRQMPAGDVEAQYALADATLDRIHAARNVSVTWLAEDLDGATGIGAAQTAGVMLNWPASFRWFLAFEGDVLFLDGGELDLGVVRDSALNAVNKYETFFESFEGLHFRGADKPLVITSTVEPSGAAAALVATATGNATADF